MAGNYKYSGARIQIDTASDAITSGSPTVQEGFFGIALTSAASGEPLMIAIEGVWNIEVPAGVAKGDILHIPGANGVLTEDAVVAAAAFTETPSNTNSPVAIAVTTRDSAGYADVLILPRAAGRAATQV